MTIRGLFSAHHDPGQDQLGQALWSSSEILAFYERASAGCPASPGLMLFYYFHELPLLKCATTCSLPWRNSQIRGSFKGIKGKWNALCQSWCFNAGPRKYGCHMLEEGETVPGLYIPVHLINSHVVMLLLVSLLSCLPVLSPASFSLPANDPVAPGPHRTGLCDSTWGLKNKPGRSNLAPPTAAFRRRLCLDPERMNFPPGKGPQWGQKGLEEAGWKEERVLNSWFPLCEEYNYEENIRQLPIERHPTKSLTRTLQTCQDHQKQKKVWGTVPARRSLRRETWCLNVIWDPGT